MPAYSAIDDVVLGMSTPGEDMSLSSALGGIYGLSMIEMVSEFKRTGRFYVPWVKGVSKGLAWAGINPNVVGKYTSIGLEGARFGNVAKKTGLMGKLMGGYKGASKLGRIAMGASRIAGAGLAWMSLTDPLWYTFSAISKPALLPVTIPLGLLWFGGRKVLGETARNLESSHYLRMNVPFADSMGAVTSRQRAVRAISESHLQARSAIGNEAMLFHR